MKLKSKKWASAPLRLKYAAYTCFFAFWIGLGYFFSLIFDALTNPDQAHRYVDLFSAALWVFVIYKNSEFANLRRARRRYMQWLVVEQMENKYWQEVFKIMVYFIILTRGNGQWTIKAQE